VLLKILRIHRRHTVELTSSRNRKELPNEVVSTRERPAICQSGRVLDISGSLTRQSLLVAAACLIVDVGSRIANPGLSWNWQAVVIVCGMAVLDTALAGPARSSGLVACAYSVLILITPLLVPGQPGAVSRNAGFLVAGYRAGAWLGRTQATVALLAMCAGQLGCHLLSDQRYRNEWLLGFTVLSVAVLPWLVGRYTTARRAYLDELERAAERRKQTERATIQRAVAEERSAIARDLHDVISHHVSAINVHAGAARMGLAKDPDPALRRALSAVESSSQSAMADLRRLLDLLHGTRNDAEHQPGLDNLPELLDSMRAAGLSIQLTTRGQTEALADSIDIALYRIAQEALTNALRHGGDGQVDVELAYQQGTVTLQVGNAMPEQHPEPVATESPHRGLAGIRQRVALFGGTVHYGPCELGRRWRLTVRFPLEYS
jgi:signal transduction histidine kinase